MNRPAANTEGAAQSYGEEPLKPVLFALLAAVLLVSVPMGWMIWKIDYEGAVSANTTKYNTLAMQVSSDVEAIHNLMDNVTVDESALSSVAAAPVVTLITPQNDPANTDEIAEDPGKLDVKLSAIYWNPRSPLVTIEGETYSVGEKVKGFRIAEIRETEVIFKNPFGDTVVKYFYEYLDKPKRK